MSQTVINYLGRFVNPEGTKLEVEIADATINIAGNALELYGAGIGTRPAANAVTIGTIFEDVTAQVFYQSNGANWVVV